MKKIVTIIIGLMMAVAVNAQAVKFGRVFASNHYYLKVGDYEFNTLGSPASNKLVIDRWFSLYNDAFDEDEIQNVCDYIYKNKASIEDKFGITINVVMEVVNKEPKYTGDVIITRQKDCEEYQAKKAEEKNKRLNSIL